MVGIGPRIVRAPTGARNRKNKHKIKNRAGLNIVTFFYFMYYLGFSISGNLSNL